MLASEGSLEEAALGEMEAGVGLIWGVCHEDLIWYKIHKQTLRYECVMDINVVLVHTSTAYSLIHCKNKNVCSFSSFSER